MRLAKHPALGSAAAKTTPASLELGAMGQYNEDFTALGGWLTLKYAF